MEKEEIKVGDYVEPIHENFKDLVDNDFNYEKLYGFVIAKNDNLITVRSISDDSFESIWDERRFRKAEVPEIFNDEKVSLTK